MANNIITINRGDSYNFDLTICDESTEDGLYHLSDEDAVYFGLMDPHQPFEFALIKKKYTVDSDDVSEEGGVISIKIKPEDTLDLFPGRYYYMIKLKMKHYNLDGELVEGVQTIINKTLFIIYA